MTVERFDSCREALHLADRIFASSTNMKLNIGATNQLRSILFAGKTQAFLRKQWSDRRREELFGSLGSALVTFGEVILPMFTPLSDEFSLDKGNVVAEKAKR